MYNWLVKFPDRTAPDLPKETYITAENPRTAWDKAKKANPYDRVVIEAVDTRKGGTWRVPG